MTTLEFMHQVSEAAFQAERERRRPTTLRLGHKEYEGFLRYKREYFDGSIPPSPPGDPERALGYNIERVDQPSCFELR